MLSEPVSEQIMSPTQEQEQEARAQLRESFLRAINELNGKPCKILTYEKSELTATFSGWQPSGSEVLVRDLETPASIKMASAVLRTPDIIAIKFQEPVDLP